MIEDVILKLLTLQIPHELIVAFVATLPIAELRGALPLGINQFDIVWYKAYIIAVIGNLIPVPVILLFLDPITRLITRVEIGRKFMSWVFARARRQSSTVEKYELPGLTLFVAIPLPFTGAWTGSIVAFLLGIKFWPAFLHITFGVLIAGVIVTTLCLLGWTGAIIAGIGLCSAFIIGWLKSGR